jgi:hypothetical protein
VSPDTSLRLGLRSGGGGGAARLRWDAEAAVKASGDTSERRAHTRSLARLVTRSRLLTNKQRTKDE